MSVSGNVVILTKQEFDDAIDAAEKKAFTRGRRGMPDAHLAAPAEIHFQAHAEHCVFKTEWPLKNRKGECNVCDVQTVHYIANVAK